jgi:hypothetical protein
MSIIWQAFLWPDPPAGVALVERADGTYSLNSIFARFFFQCDRRIVHALDARGSGLIEASTGRLKYRKCLLG